LKHIGIQRFENGTEDASTTNDIWKITKEFRKHQIERYTPIIHGRRGLTYTKPQQLQRYRRTCYDQTLRSKMSIRREISDCFQLQPVNPTTTIHRIRFYE
jgi:hypothetical protein